MIQRNFQPVLDNDEKILWEKREVSNKLSKFSGLITAAIIFIVIAYLSAFILWITGDQSLNKESIGPVLVFIGLSIPFWYLFSSAYNQLRKILIAFNIKPKNLKEFEEIYILTSKRWIQKSFFYGVKDLFKDFQGIVSSNNGIVEVSLNNFEVLYSTPFYRKKKRMENFFIKWNQNSEESNFPVAVSIEEHEEFMAAFYQVFRVKNEKKDFFVKDDFVYYLELL
jgi:hypothetical protein